MLEVNEISDEELKVFMATEIMGWHKGLHGKYWLNVISQEVVEVYNYNPPTDLNQAFECARKVLNARYPKRGWINLQLYADDRPSQATLYALDSDMNFFGTAKTDKHPARAVCLAVKALKDLK